MSNSRKFLYKEFEKPQAVEQLVLKVNPELQEKFLQNDHELWTLGEAGQYTFAGKENWCSESDPSRVYLLVYFEELIGWHSIPEDFLVETEAEMQRRMGKGNVDTLEYVHDQDMQYKVSEYMPEIKKGEWELTKYAATSMMEELVFKVDEEFLDEYLKVDQEIWSEALGTCEGFMGKETLISSKTGLVTNIIYWECKEQRESIDQALLSETDEKMHARMGNNAYQLVRKGHEADQKIRLTSYRR